MLVGASGTLLTLMMSRAMNRSIANVLFGAFGQVAAGGRGSSRADGGTVRSATAEDVAVMLAYAHKSSFVPGYGLAVAQAQHDVRELADLLEETGVEVSYAIHPVAGRMPGHMNVLLAEANVPYAQLEEMDEANPEFGRTDVALVVGANDVVNPAARNNQRSPIYGMPILNVDQAQTVVVLKRSMNPGLRGDREPALLHPKTLMLFGDAKESIAKLIERRQGPLAGIVRSSQLGTSRPPSRRSRRSRRCATRSSPTGGASGRCRRRCTCRPTRPATSGRCRCSGPVTRR